MGKNWDNPKAAENGKKGGRPKKTSTIYAQKFRDELAQMIMDDVGAFVNALKPKALEGDVPAFKELMDRAFGKPKQPLTGGDEDDRPVGVIVLPELTDE